MSRPSRLVFAALAAFFVVFPLTVQKPGMPMGLKSDEPAYYLAALSIGRDFDLDCGVEDIRRLGTEFPYDEVSNLILMSRDGWRTVHFGKPYLVSLLAAPLTSLAGADGFVATNMALLFLAIWLAARYLARFNPEWLALTVASGFFLLSNIWSYVFWMHTEVLCVTAVTACLYLGLTPAPGAPATTRLGRLWARVWNQATRPAWSGAALVAAAYNKPQLALLGLPALFVALRGRGLRGGATWIAGAAAAGALVCGLSLAWTGQASAYLGAERAGVKVLTFDRMPELPTPPPEAAAQAQQLSYGPKNSWAWIFRPPELDARLPKNLGYFFVGRHTGIFVYAPFTLLCLLLFLAFERRSAERWLLVASLAGVALFALLWIPWNYHGGGGFVGNRYFVNALPGFLFLATRIAPAWLPVAGFALAGALVGPLVFTPYGAVVSQPTLQAHVRNRPFRLFPLELTVAGQIPGYRGWIGAGDWWFGRRDVFFPVGDSFWVGGGQPVQIHVRAPAPYRRPVFQVETQVAPNRVRIELGGSARRIDFERAGAAGATRVTLTPAPPDVEREWDGGEYFPYTLRIDAETQAWRTEYVATKPPTEEEAAGEEEARRAGEPVAPRPEVEEVTFLVGAVVTYLGEESELDADAFSIAWEAGAVPPELPAGRLLHLRGVVRNTSTSVWPARGATRVALAYHWLAPDGTTVEREGLRSALPRDVQPGEAVEVRMEVATPKAPGDYLLELDAVRERLAWFSDRRPETTLRRPIRVVAPGR
jgi:hypothetical protein